MLRAMGNPWFGSKAFLFSVGLRAVPGQEGAPLGRTVAGDLVSLMPPSRKFSLSGEQVGDRDAPGRGCGDEAQAGRVAQHRHRPRRAGAAGQAPGAVRCPGWGSVGRCDYPVELVHGDCHAYLSEFAFDGSELVYSDPPYLHSARKSFDAVTATTTTTPTMQRCSGCSGSCRAR